MAHVNVAVGQSAAKSSPVYGVFSGHQRGRARMHNQMCTVPEYAYPKRWQWRGCLLQGFGVKTKCFSFGVRAKKNSGRDPVMQPGEGSQNREPVSETSHFVSKNDESLKEKVVHIMNMKARYLWLLGPILSTAAIFLPPILFPLEDLFQKSYWVGLVATFGFDILFVLPSDLFFVLSDRTGHHQEIPGGPPPWIGPWEYTGYPKGLPYLRKCILYVATGLALLAILVSTIVGKLAVALVAFGPYLVLILAQVAYERLLETDRVPVYPVVSIAYTAYRFRQLARGMEMIAVFGGGIFFAGVVRLLMVIWTWYFAIHLAQIPWLYSTWNANRTM